MMITLKNSEGFTLVELMVAVGISSFIMYGIYLGMQTGDAQVKTADVAMTIQDSAREGLYKMIQELRHSSSNATNGNIVVATNSITFNIPNPANPVAADFTENWASTHRIQYALSGTQLIRTNTTTNETTVIGNDLTSVSFSVSGEVVTATINVQRELINGQNIPETPLQLSAQAELRNS